MTFLAEIETAVNAGFRGVAETFGGGLLATFRPVFIVGFAIWITLIAYETAFGKNEDGITYTLTKIFRMFLIGTIALNGWPLVSELLDGIRVGFVGNGVISGVLESKLINPMVALYTSLFAWYGAAIEALGFYELAELVKVTGLFALVFIVYFAMAIAIAVVCIISLAMFLIASSTFTLLLAIGPFFLLCLAFPFTQRFFETYIGNVVTAILAMAFTVLLVLFVSNFFGLSNAGVWVVPVTGSEDIFLRAKSLMIVFAGKAAIALLIVYMYFKIWDLAAALGGGLNLGNNIVGATRSLYRQALQLRSQQPGKQSGQQRGGGSSPNQVNRAGVGARSGVAHAAAASVRGARGIGSYAYNSLSRSRRASA
jgi:type IV secretion system protein VirB6